MRTPGRAPLPLLLTGLLLAAAAPGVAHVASAEDPTPVPVTARSTAELLDSLGVVVHTDRSTGPYLDGALVAQRLGELGLRHVRTHLSPVPLDSQQRTLSALAAAGVGLDVTGVRPSGDPVLDAANAQRLVASMSAYPGPLDAVEGANEYDVRGPADWPARLRDGSAALREAVRTAPDPRFPSLPVLSPSLVGFRLATDAPLLGDLTAVTSGGSLHSYPAGGAPETGRLSADADVLRRNVSGLDRPVLVTETGYHGAVAAPGGVPDDVAATYVPRLLLDDFRAGFPRTYLYELADEGVDVDGATVPETALADPEAHFGLLDTALTPKPAGRAVRTLTQLLADPPGAVPQGGSLAYALSGAPSDLRQVLLRRADGTFWLALWRALPVYDAAARQPLAVPAVPVRVALGPATAELTAYDVGRGTAPVAATRGSSLDVQVGADVQLVQVRLVQGAPTGVRATALDGAAQVAWTAPPAGPAPLTGYRVTPSPSGVPVVVAPGTTSTTVGGLANGVAHTFTVTALSASGDSLPSAPSAPVVPAGAPPAPGPVTAVVGSTNVLVRWGAAATTGGPVLRYTVTASPGGSTAQVDGTTTSAVVGGLTNGTAYTFTVTATTAAGTGPGVRSRSYVPSPARTVLDDRSTAVTPGGWTAVVDKTSPGGSYRVSRTAGDTVRVPFSGDGLTWSTRTGPGAGQVSAAVDGLPARAVTLTTGRSARGALPLSGYGPGDHVLTLTVTSSGLPVVVEGFGTAAGTLDDPAPALGWSGWRGSASPVAVGGGTLTSGPGRASISVTASGTGLEWTTAVGPGAGTATVVLDGVPQPPVDLRAATPGTRTLSWLGLSSARHTLTVTADGTGDVLVDAFGAR